MEDKPTILVVDDEPAIRMGLAATIGRRGYNVITAENGGDGLLRAREAHPDLIVSDVMMPGVNGFEMKKRMEAEPALASIPFIFLTARTASEDKLLGIRSGADDYVTKPFESEELIARIEAVLRRVHWEQERGRELERHSAQEEMEVLRRELIQNFRHELRTPLSNIMMSLEMMVNNKFDSSDDQSEFIRIAHSSGERLESLVADIVILMDIDQGRLNRMRQSIDVENHILRPILKRLDRYRSKNLQFDSQLNLETSITAPRREFSQALVHLADNAFKFSPEGGRVTFTARSEGNGDSIFLFEDEGEGIPSALREKVFEKFHQVSQGDNRKYEGLGVGLTIARAVFRTLDGDVLLLDAARGCRVQALLPASKEGDLAYG